VGKCRKQRRKWSKKNKTRNRYDHSTLTMPTIMISTTTANNMTINSHVTPDLSRRAAAEYDERLYKDCHKNWIRTVQKVVSHDLFRKQQWIFAGVDEAFGSVWQKAVCNKVNVPMQHRQRFWENGGRVEARTQINRKRSNTAGAMKKAFEGWFLSSNQRVYTA
jgi:hypothetical protein